MTLVRNCEFHLTFKQKCNYIVTSEIILFVLAKHNCSFSYSLCNNITVKHVTIPII